MNKSLLFKILVTVIAFVSITGGAYAQVTTSTLTGTIKDSMESLPGATIKAIHTPTGTSYGAITNKDGRFTISNMRVGGPYTIQVSFLGYQTEKVEGVYLKLGETFSVNVKLNGIVNLI